MLREIERHTDNTQVKKEDPQSCLYGWGLEQADASSGQGCKKPVGSRMSVRNKKEAMPFISSHWGLGVDQNPKGRGGKHQQIKVYIYMFFTMVQ
jgi:hypothetical protein